MNNTIKDLEGAAAALDRAWRDIAYASRAIYRVAINKPENRLCQFVGSCCDELAKVVYRVFAWARVLLNDMMEDDSDEDTR